MAGFRITDDRLVTTRCHLASPSVGRLHTARTTVLNTTATMSHRDGMSLIPETRLLLAVLATLVVLSHRSAHHRITSAPHVFNKIELYVSNWLYKYRNVMIGDGHLYGSSAQYTTIGITHPNSCVENIELYYGGHCWPDFARHFRICRVRKRQ